MATNAGDVKINVEDTDRQPDTDSLREFVIQSCREGKSGEVDCRLKKISKDDKQKLLNKRNYEGTTALHESCCHGESGCAKILLNHGADAIIWDLRGFSPIHCAAYNGHTESVRVLLTWEPPTRANMTKCEVDTLSQYNETALHIACLRGHLELAEFLVTKEANLNAVDRDKNTVLHHAVASNSGELLMWLLSMDEVKSMISATNEFEQTVAHRAAVLGCVRSVSVLVRFGADFNAKDKDGRSALDLAKLLSNRQCYEIASGKKSPLPTPETPPSMRAAFSLSSSDHLPTLLPQRSISNGSSISPATSSPQPLRRRGSMTRRNRPISQYISRTGSFQSRDLDSSIGFEVGHRRSFSSRGSLQTIGSLAGYGLLTGQDSIASIATLHGSTDNFRYTSKDTLTVLEEDEKNKKKSKSPQEMEMKLLFASSYEPPPDLHFIPPLECDKLSPDNNLLYSSFHGISLRIPGEHWEAAKDKEVEVRICATMGLNQYPDNYVIVSPISFISCKCQDKEVTIKLNLPHAASIQAPEYRSKIRILSTMSMVKSKNPNTPLSTPTDRKLHPLDVVGLELDIGEVHFKLKLLHPALFAVAVACTPTGIVPRPIPIPLRCSLYVLYKVHTTTDSLSRVFVHTYVALRLKTVDTDMRDIAKQEELELECSGFELNSPSVQVTASLKNTPDEWDITPIGSGLFGYDQVALTSQALDHNHSSDIYSHDHPYPLRQRFFIEPKNARRAVKCEVAVSNTITPIKTLTSLLVFPYSPTSKDTTPEPSSRSSTRPSSPSGSRQLLRSGQSDAGSLSLTLSSRNASYTSESVV